MLDQQYDTFHNGSWVHLTINGVYGSSSRELPRKTISGTALEEAPLLTTLALP
jgi:hypothetical protein